MTNSQKFNHTTHIIQELGDLYMILYHQLKLPQFGIADRIVIHHHLHLDFHPFWIDNVGLIQQRTVFSSIFKMKIGKLEQGSSPIMRLLVLKNKSQTRVHSLAVTKISTMEMKMKAINNILIVNGRRRNLWCIQNWRMRDKLVLLLRHNAKRRKSNLFRMYCKIGARLDLLSITEVEN